MKTKLRILEILLAGVVAASLSACIDRFQAGCVRNADGGWSCAGDYDPMTNTPGL